jgi:hypothetical protein
VETTHELLNKTSKVNYSKISMVYVQALFKSLFCLTMLLNVRLVENVENMLGQMLNHSE